MNHVQKMNRTKFVDLKFFFLQLLFSSFFCRTRFNDSKTFWKRDSRFPWGPKWGALMVWLIFFIQRRGVSLQPGLEFNNFKPWIKSCVFKCISWLSGSFFGRDDWGFLKKTVKTWLMAPMSPRNSPIFFCSYICSLCSQSGRPRVH